MIDPKILSFLSSLKENNNREWFNEHKPEYKDAKAAFDEFINKLIPGLREFDSSIDMITAKDCTFRIYRDVRFSKDKSPYKTNLGGYIARGGRKSNFAGYYVHVEPGQSFLAGGMYMPPPDVLKKIREEIFHNVDEFKQIINDQGFKKTFGEFMDDNKLKNPPKGYDKEWPDIDLLKYKSYAVMHRVEDEKLGSPGYLDYALGVFKELYPLNRYFNDII
jgi:uncharacterized protein (TIGR02453 family)